jgi:hypothetical protein
MIGDHPVGDHFVAAADNLLKLAFLLPGIIFTGSVGPGCFRCSKSGAETHDQSLTLTGNSFRYEQR